MLHLLGMPFHITDFDHPLRLSLLHLEAKPLVCIEIQLTDTRVNWVKFRSNCVSTIGHGLRGRLHLAYKAHIQLRAAEI